MLWPAPSVRQYHSDYPDMGAGGTCISFNFQPSMIHRNGRIRRRGTASFDGAQLRRQITIKCCESWRPGVDMRLRFRTSTSQRSTRTMPCVRLCSERCDSMCRLKDPSRVRYGCRSEPTCRCTESFDIASRLQQQRPASKRAYAPPWRYLQVSSLSVISLAPIVAIYEAANVLRW